MQHAICLQKLVVIISVAAVIDGVVAAVAN